MTHYVLTDHVPFWDDVGGTGVRRFPPGTICIDEQARCYPMNSPNHQRGAVDSRFRQLSPLELLAMQAA